ncbi:LytTR family DNA-binding domain-containing protein [Pedobacter sp. SYP-B3415]|uniref:LytR/AlgR family response regulator transcription factor n=1 Tax=Pedobacter sp. SYP-B3415 TaxID=2496641 RepID=UPI0013EA5F2A|nr:LytTR family DNA-binding domain-containing protein [Pedobacter sp. SYP-B3415]
MNLQDIDPKEGGDIPGPKFKRRFLVTYREKLIPLVESEIGAFCIEDKAVYIHTMANRQYVISYTLEQLETLLDPAVFFRANRQSLIAYHAIRELEYYDERKLKVILKCKGPGEVVVSKAKAQELIAWLENQYN